MVNGSVIYYMDNAKHLIELACQREVLPYYYLFPYLDKPLTSSSSMNHYYPTYLDYSSFLVKMAIYRFVYWSRITAKYWQLSWVCWASPSKRKDIPLCKGSSRNIQYYNSGNTTLFFTLLSIKHIPSSFPFNIPPYWCWFSLPLWYDIGLFVYYML